MRSVLLLETGSIAFLKRKPSKTEFPLIDRGVSSSIVGDLKGIGGHDKLIRLMDVPGPRGEHSTAIIVEPENIQIKSLICHGWFVIKTSYSDMILLRNHNIAALQYMFIIYRLLETDDIGMRECVAWIRDAIVRKVRRDNGLLEFGDTGWDTIDAKCIQKSWKIII